MKNEKIDLKLNFENLEEVLAPGSFRDGFLDGLATGGAIIGAIGLGILIGGLT
ncbi:hypothetical protein [Neobacillus sp. PS3-40]|uniref:hypothetical protein n=1 Tax=Neobacillus sp. PS3-40 TaxID=3070679 RepID=UPI0027E04957|nr:hypothetical protein [Neobacillus sp. PS3-40]WML46154.1 hypothetical protein RCG20_09795 [Neobacillus sp. PS3-40]